MKTVTLTACIVTLAIGGLAFATQDPKSAPQEGKAASAASERVVHVYRADQLHGLSITGAGEKSIGELDSLIVDSTSGRIAYAVVTNGGVLGLGEDKRLLPWTALKFAPKLDKENKELDECEVRMVLSKEQFETCPAFKKGEPISAEIERRAHEGARLTLDPILARGLPARFVGTADLEGCEVRSKANDALGKLERVLVDPMEGCIAYTVLEAGSQHVALPWQVTEVRRDKDQAVLLSTGLTKEMLETCPMYVEKDWKLMTSSKWMRNLATHHKVEPFWIHASPASAGRSN